MRRKFALLTLLFAFAATSQVLFAASNATVGLCAGGGVHYTTIQAAVNAVSAKPAPRTVNVCPGIYAEQVKISASLTLQGSTNGTAYNPVIVPPAGGLVANTNDLFGYPSGQPTAAQILVAPSSPTSAISVIISNLTVDGTNNGINGGCGTDLVGIYYQNASGTINHVATRFQELAPDLFGCQDGLAIYVQSGYGSGGTATVTVENSSVHDYDKGGITADGSGTTATITGNYVVGIGATPLIAQNGIQVSDGATGKVSSNTVSANIYVNPPDCQASNACYGSSGILIYDAGDITVSSNNVSDSQLPIVTYGDFGGTADGNTVSSNKVTTAPASGPYLDDGIDLCSNSNTASANVVFYASGSGVHLDSSCTEAGSVQSGTGTATGNTINEACAGVLTGSNGGTQSGTTAYNVIATTASGDACPSGEDGPRQGAAQKSGVKLMVRPFHQDRR